MPGCAVIGLPGLAWSPAHQTLNLHVKSAELSTEHGAGHGHCRGMFRHQPRLAPASFNMLSNVRRAESCGNTIILFEVVLLPTSTAAEGRREKIHKHNSHSDFIPGVRSMISDVVYHFVYYGVWNG